MNYCKQTGDINIEHIIPFSIDTIALILLLSIGLVTIKRLRQNQKLRALFKYAFYVSFIAASAAISIHMGSFIACNTRNNLNPNMFKLSHLLMYGCLLNSILFTVIARLHITFKHSAYKISTMHMTILCTLFALAVLWFLFSYYHLMTWSLSHPREAIVNAPMLTLEALINGLLSTIITVYTMVLFVYKLMKLVKLRASSMINVMDIADMRQSHLLLTLHLTCLTLSHSFLPWW
eukprot:1070330_1